MYHFSCNSSYVEAKLLERDIAYAMGKVHWEEVVNLASRAREKFEELFVQNR